MSKEEEKVIPVRVAVRCRPMVQWESEEGCVPCVTFVPGEPQIVLSGEKAFTFDFVFDPATEQEEVFSSAVSPLIDGIFKGYNATVLAYGQTGSGKTFTMGGAYSGDAEPHATGVIPRAVHALFRGVQSRGTVEFSVSVSYLEIYKEDIIDLLCVSKDRPPLSVREDPKEGIKICGLTERVVASAEDMVRCLEQGNLARTVGATAMNAQSSRSHAIFTIAIEQRGKEDRESHCRSKLHLVDLAGSERVKRTKAEGDRLREGITINRGLLALGNVISALGEEGAARRTHHVPYRDSRLTRLLQDSLGGNSLTLMVACVSPADSNLEETLNTLRYADRARKIKNKPVVNRDPSTAELQMLRKQVQQLQVQLLQAQGGGIATMQGSGEGQSTSVQSVLERNRSLHEANQQLTKELQVAVDHTAHLCEKVILTEMEREKLLTRFAELKDHKACRLDIMSLVDSQGEEGSLRQQLELLQSLQELINELETDTSSLDPLDAEGKEGGSPGDEACIAGEGGERLSDSSFSARHTLRQAQLTRELLELNRALEMKEQLARGASRNDCKMDELSTTYTEGIKGLEKEVSSLQREKEELTSALQAAMKDTTHAKLSEQRRKRLQELEAQMSDLKKKIAEQTRLLRLKENTVRSVSKLHSEIQAMKTQRVQLMRQMKEDAEKFRQWKAQKDKEVLQLKEKDRKRQYELVKLERDFQKQAAVLRRKTEEAGAANRRLRDALTRQKEVAEKRKETQSRGAETLATRVKTWLAHELEVLVSTEDARRHLADLLEDRAVLASDLARLRHQRDESRGPACSQPPSKIRRRTLLLSELEEALGPSEELSQQIVSLETEIGLRSAQIADLQQKLLGVGSEERGRQRWDAITTILEAKCALRWLLDQLVAARVGSARASEELREAREARDEALRSATEERDSAREERERLVEEMGRLETEHQDKVLLLLNQLQSSSGHQSGDQQRESNLCLQKEQLEQMAQLREENQTLQQKVQQLQRTKKRLPAALGAVGDQTGPRAASPDSSLEFVLLKKSTAKQRRPSAPARPLVSLSHILSETETSDSDGETRGSGGPVDADWEPGGAAASRPSLQRRSKNSTAPGCRCGGRCVNRLCGCQRAGLECVAWRCGCDHDKCRNRSDAGGKVAAEKLETSSSSDGSFKRDEPSGVVRPPGESFFMPPDVAPSPQVLKEMGDTGLLSALSDPSLRTSLLTNASPAQELRAGGGGGSGGGGSGGGGAAKKRQLLRLGHSGLLAACSPVPPM